MAPARTHAMITQQGPGLSEIMEGRNFENEILLRERGYEDSCFYY